MATDLFLRDLVSTKTTLFDPRQLRLTRGPSSTTSVTNTVAGPTSGINVTKTAGSGVTLWWFSESLNAVSISGSITINVWAFESAAQANATIFADLDSVDVNGDTTGGFGAFSVYFGGVGTELGTTTAARNWSFTPTAGFIPQGGYIRLKLSIDDANGVTMGSGRTVTLNYDGPTAAATGDSYVRFTETITEEGRVYTSPQRKTMAQLLAH